MVRITQNNHFFYVVTPYLSFVEFQPSHPRQKVSLGKYTSLRTHKIMEESEDLLYFLRPSDTFCFLGQKENRPFPFLGKICISLLCFLYRVFMKNCGFSKILKNIPDSWSVSVCSGLFRRCTCVYVRLHARGRQLAGPARRSPVELAEFRKMITFQTR